MPVSVSRGGAAETVAGESLWGGRWWGGVGSGVAASVAGAHWRKAVVDDCPVAVRLGPLQSGGVMSAGVSAACEASFSLQLFARSSARTTT